MLSQFLRFIDDRSGATAIEYGLIASFVATALIAVLAVLTPEISAVFNRISTALGS